MIGTFVSIAAFQATTLPMWEQAGVADDADSYVAFRSTFNTRAGHTSLRILGASEYLVWLDGTLIHDGPARFAKDFPEYQTVELTTKPGKHTLAIQVHNEGVTTRILSKMHPFLWTEVATNDDPIPLVWRCASMFGYSKRVHRISDILGWIEWSDTNRIWPDWQQPGFNDSTWRRAVPVDPQIGEIQAAKTHPVRLIERAIAPMAKGDLASAYGYEADEPGVRFFLDDLDPKSVPPQGVWRRYDLGRVRLGRPKFTLDLPNGAIVEFAECEQLRHGRVHPWITLSGSTTCNFDHFVARGGPQEFMPFTPKGGRFLEVHIRANGPIKFLREGYLERTYYGEPVGSFTCNDPLLNKIWRTGVETMRACSEDSFVDCPTRERGEWTGDVASVATDIAAVAYGDLSLSRRALVQAAQSARADGLVAGVGPGDPGYLSTYATQWVTACLHYWELTGDKSLLQELLPAARKNMAAIEAKTSSSGVEEGLGWAFVDWGYVRNEGPTDMALNLHALRALREMARWERATGNESDSKRYTEEAAGLEAAIRVWLTGQLSKPGGWTNVGYHRASLALLCGLVAAPEQPKCIAFIKNHLLKCFPNDPSGPRLSDPGVTNERIMTPYFAHFAFAALLDHGESDFVLNQYRKCWGWALGDGRTTWLEVFDPRWSHCHEWSGCPTWQLSRYVLGLQPRFDLGNNTYGLNLRPGSLTHASGIVPSTNGNPIKVSWTHQGKTVRLTIQSDEPVSIITDEGTVTIRGSMEIDLKTP